MCVIRVTKEGGESQDWKLCPLPSSWLLWDNKGWKSFAGGEAERFFCFLWHLRTEIAEEIGKRAEANVIKSPYKHLQKSKGKDLRFGKVSALVIFSDITLKKEN